MRKRSIVLLLVAGVVAVSAVLVAQRLRSRAAAAGQVTPAASASSPPATRPRQAADLAETIYDGRLSSGWQDLGWGPHELGSGPAKVRFAARGGIILHHAPLAWQYGGVVFRYRAPAEWGSFLNVQLRPEPGARSFPTVSLGERHLLEQPDGWQEAFVSYSELNPELKPFVGLVISTQKVVGSDWVMLDRVALTKPPASLAAPGRSETLRVFCDSPSLPIDPRIYGAASNEWSSGQTSLRLGGNTYSRMNWELGTWNTGSDWFFENQGGESLFAQLEAHAKQKRPVALVVPIIGYVAKDRHSVGFPRAKYGPQRKHDPQRGEAGDGHSTAGEPLTPGDPSQTSIPAPPELIAQWVKKLREADQARGSRAVELYILDNEPTLWNETHRDVHPAPLSYDELLDRTVRYASAVKDADPEAVVAGPAEWGWTGYFYSAVDREAGTSARPDRRAHGDEPLLPWYLRSLAEREKSGGRRLLDVLDVHFYPMAPGVRDGSEKVDAEGAARRLRSTRALWDPSYQDESWIGDAVQLIPRLKGWVAKNYPGTKIAIGEWSFGAAEHISGGLATAEALGRFGREGLDAAYHWGGLPLGTPTFWAFRAFTNFDGEGGRFLNTSLKVEDSSQVSLFASRDDARKHLVLILVNKDPHAVVAASVDLSSCGRVTSSRMFSYDGASTRELKEQNHKLSVESAQPPRASLSPYSITVLDLKVEPPAR
jgi:hypothetical protein